MKKWLLGIGTLSAIAVPIVAVVSCGEIDDTSNPQEININHKYNAVALIDHGETRATVEIPGTMLKQYMITNRCNAHTAAVHFFRIYHKDTPSNDISISDAQF